VPAASSSAQLQKRLGRLGRRGRRLGRSRFPKALVRLSARAGLLELFDCGRAEEEAPPLSTCRSRSKIRSGRRSGSRNRNRNQGPQVSLIVRVPTAALCPGPGEVSAQGIPVLGSANEALECGGGLVYSGTSIARRRCWRCRACCRRGVSIVRRRRARLSSSRLLRRDASTPDNFPRGGAQLRKPGMRRPLDTPGPPTTHGARLPTGQPRRRRPRRRCQIRRRCCCCFVTVCARAGGGGRAAVVEIKISSGGGRVRESPETQGGIVL